MMRARIPFFTTFIFLCGIFSTEAAAQTDSVALKAARLEREVYLAASADEANSALARKAGCYADAGRYEEALFNLSRVRMYALTGEQRREVLEKRAFCAWKLGRYDEAISHLTEAGIITEEDLPKYKSPALAMALTFLVPAGFIYVGEPVEGIASTILNAGSVAWVVTQISGGCWISAILGGCIALNTTFTGAQNRVADHGEGRNAEVSDVFLRSHLGEE